MDEKRVPLAGSERRAPDDARLGGALPAETQIRVSVIVKRRQPLDLTQLDGPISHEEFAAQYGADDESFAQVRAFADQHGLTVDEGASSLPRRTMVLHGSAAAMQRAFQVELKEYVHQGARFHAREGSIHLPPELADTVEAVLGLDNRPQAKPHFRPAVRADTSYTPIQIAEHYDFPPGDGSGQTIALIELGGGFAASDINTYFSALGITAPSVTAVSVDGGKNTPGDPSGADGEVMLDIEVAGAIAPAAKIVVYFTANTDQGFLDAITTAVHDTSNNPKIVSISWGGPESTWTAQAMNAMDSACQSAAALGVTVLVASGDNGSNDGVKGGKNHVDFPASSPHVVACGGTSLPASGAESVWNNGSGGGASGGGVSAFFAKPDWQANANVPAPSTSAGGRGVPDVAGDADPQTGYQIRVDGTNAVYGGTSAVAPLWAGLLARINQQRTTSVGFVNASLYAAAAATFHDITQGNNGSFSAAVGWDACTGLGSPDGTKLLAALGSTSKKKKHKPKAH